MLAIFRISPKLQELLFTNQHIMMGRPHEHLTCTPVASSRVRDYSISSQVNVEPDALGRWLGLDCLVTSTTRNLHAAHV